MYSVGISHEALVADLANVKECKTLVRITYRIYFSPIPPQCQVKLWTDSDFFALTSPIPRGRIAAMRKAEGKISLKCGCGGIGRLGGFRFHCQKRAGSSPVTRTISSVHNGFDRCGHSIFMSLCMSRLLGLLSFYALLVTYSTATPLRVSAV